MEEAASGVKGENSVKVYGNDLETFGEDRGQHRRCAGQGAGHHGPRRAAVAGPAHHPHRRGPRPRGSLWSRPRRHQCGGSGRNRRTKRGRLVRGNERPAFSDDGAPGGAISPNLDVIKHIQVAVQGESGNGIIHVPLEEVADVRLVSGAAFIYREQQQRYVPIKFSVRGRDLGSAVLEAQHVVDSQVLLPGGYRLEWVGEFGNLQDAISRLSLVVPLSIALIVLLLYVNFGSLRDALLAASVIPMALLGGIFALWVTGTAFSVSSAIGFVALFGIAAMDGILVLSYFNRCLDAGLDRPSAILRTCRTQLRPVVMTCIVACVGLIPAAFSTGIGSQVQRPLALVVVGGMLLAPVLILLVLPVLILKFARARELPAEPAHETVA